MTNILTLPRIIIILAYILTPMNMEAIIVSFGIAFALSMGIEFLNR